MLAPRQGRRFAATPAVVLRNLEAPAVRRYHQLKLERNDS